MSVYDDLREAADLFPIGTRIKKHSLLSYPDIMYGTVVSAENKAGRIEYCESAFTSVNMNDHVFIAIQWDHNRPDAALCAILAFDNKKVKIIDSPRESDKHLYTIKPDGQWGYVEAIDLSNEHEYFEVDQVRGTIEKVEVPF